MDQQLIFFINSLEDAVGKKNEFIPSAIRQIIEHRYYPFRRPFDTWFLQQSAANRAWLCSDYSQIRLKLIYSPFERCLFFFYASYHHFIYLLLIFGHLSFIVFIYRIISYIVFVTLMKHYFAKYLTNMIKISFWNYFVKIPRTPLEELQDSY